MSLLENNNRSEILNLLLNKALSLYLLAETIIYSQNLEIQAPQGLQGLASTKVTQASEEAIALPMDVKKHFCFLEEG